MGGNVAIQCKNNLYKAQKIPFKKINKDTASSFRNRILYLMMVLNCEFFKVNNTYIWDAKILKNGYAFNGSTSYIMNPEYINELNFKETIGDIDITVRDDLKFKIYTFLKSIEGAEIAKGIFYIGSNKKNYSSIGEQINSIFRIDFGMCVVNVQVDFEFLPYENNEPTEWSKFSHSASIQDAKLGIKAVHHKFLIRALVGAASVRNDILVCTKKSTPESYTVSTSKLHRIPRMLKFSVGRGVRESYEPLILNGEHLQKDGKMLYRELDTKESVYTTTPKEIQKLIFGESSGNLYSFCSVLQLMKQNLRDNQILETHNRYKDLLWGIEHDRAQELESQNPELDFEIKHIGYNKFVKEIGVGEYIDSIDDTSVFWYYKSYGQRRTRIS